MNTLIRIRISQDIKFFFSFSIHYNNIKINADQFSSLIIQTTHGSMTTISITLASDVVLIVQPRNIAFRLITVRAGRENQTGLCRILLFLFHFLINFQNCHQFVFIMTARIHKNKNRFISEKKITWKTKSIEDYLIL